ncbi:hypothetical protein LZ32DRAFT_426898 [Colletotrichum eremochloae]|nr:hypothetical protein LZ32DRAFT_426898 [Colletotrichum eremochloae]
MDGEGETGKKGRVLPPGGTDATAALCNATVKRPFSLWAPLFFPLGRPTGCSSSEEGRGPGLTVTDSPSDIVVRWAIKQKRRKKGKKGWSSALVTSPPPRPRRGRGGSDGECGPGLRDPYYYFFPCYFIFLESYSVLSLLSPQSLAPMNLKRFLVGSFVWCWFDPR